MYRKKEEEIFPKCDAPNCDKPGKCKAPKNNQLREYYNFCEQHAAEYNKNWNYYAGMTQDEIEAENIKDIYRRNPTWQFGINGLNKDHIKSANNATDPLDILNKIFGKSSSKNNNHTYEAKSFGKNTEIGQAIKFMKLPEEFTEDDLKKQYKKLVKLYHPDLTKDPNKQKANEEKFKNLSHSYKVLTDYIKKHK